MCVPQQEQYIFVHKTVLEALTCVNTSIESAQLGASLDELSLHDPQLGASPLEEEFAALEAMTPRPEDSVCRAAQKYSHKNRNHDYLPSKHVAPSICGLASYLGAWSKGYI